MTKRFALLTVTVITVLALLVGCGGKGGKNDKTYYTVTFDTDGGTLIASQSVESGATATAPANPKKNGHDFVEWRLDGAAFSFDTPISGDITLVALYKPSLTVRELADLWRGVETVGAEEYEYALNINDGGYSTVSYTSAGETHELTVLSLEISDGRLVITYSGSDNEPTVLSYVDGRLVGNGVNGGELVLTRQQTLTVTYNHFGGGTSIERYAAGNGFKSIDCALSSGMSFDGWYTSDGRLVSEGDAVSSSFSVYANAYTDGIRFVDGVITDYVGTSAEVTVPERLGGVAITAIGEGAFENAQIRSVSLPNGISEIRDRAFSGCSELEAIKLPTGLITLGEYAFFDCTSISKLTVPDGVERIGFACFGATLASEELEDGDIAVFSTNVSLTSISLPFIGGLKGGEGAQDVDFLAYVFGGESPECNWYDSEGREYTLGEESGTANLYYVLPMSLSSVTVRNITEVPERAFLGCMYIDSIELTGSVSRIGESAFENCYYTDVNGVSLVVVIEDRAFLASGFDGAPFLVLESIGELALAYTSVTDIYLPETLTYIGDAAFAFTELSSITFPASVGFIGDNAFYGCNSLNSATFRGTEVPEIGADIFTIVEDDAVYYTDILIFVPGTTAAGQPFEAYRSDVYMRDYASGIFPESVRGKSGYITGGELLLGYISDGEEQLEVVNVPAGIKKIADFAFYNCAKITEINMPEGFEAIGKYAFYGCTSVAYLNMPSTMKEIDDYAFTGFFVGNNVTRLYFPEGFRRLGDGAFMSSFNLRIVELPSTVEYVGYLAFGMANSLERITFASATPPTVGTYDNDGELSCEIFQIINTGKLTVFVPGGAAAAYRNADGFSNASAYVKAIPDGTEVGQYGNGSYLVELDGAGSITISKLVLAAEDTSDIGGTRYEYERVEGRYVIDGSAITVETEEYGTLVGLYVENLRRVMLVIDGEQQLFTEPKIYYDDYNWTTFKLYEDGTGVFDMYGSFLTPFKWSIEGDKFNLTIDGNNKLAENADYAGERLYVGSYDAAADSFKVEFMLNDYLTALEADVTELLYATGEITKLYGKYVAYAQNGVAMLTVVSYGNGICDFYIGESIYAGCAYTIEDGVVHIAITILDVELTMDANGRLYGGSELLGTDTLFVFVDELMDSTKMPD